MPGRRIFSLAPLACVALLALTACGDDDNAASETTAPVTTVPATTTTIADIATTLAPETSVPHTTVGSSGDATDQAPATPTAEDFLAELNAAQIAQLGGIECATELATVAAAGERYVAEVGSDPATVQDMYDNGYLEPLTLFEPDADTLKPVAGSGCADVFAANRCAHDARLITLATWTYIDANGGTAAPPQSALVEAGLLDESSTLVDVVDGQVAAVPGGRCDGVAFTIDWQSTCQADAKTLEVGIEAYQAKNGTTETPSEADLVDGFIRRVSPLVDVVDGEIVATPGRACEGLLQ